MGRFRGQPFMAKELGDNLFAARAFKVPAVVDRVRAAGATTSFGLSRQQLPYPG
jgi:hypothetical protein